MPAPRTMSFVTSSSLSALNAVAPPRAVLLLNQREALASRPGPPQLTVWGVAPPNVTVRLPPTAENPPPSPVKLTWPESVPMERVTPDRPLVPITRFGPLRVVARADWVLYPP